jgi:hypothetical protein
MTVLDKEIIDGLKKKVDDMILQAKNVSKWSIQTILDLAETIKIIVVEIETISNNFKKLTSEEKRQLAIDLIISYLDLSFLPWGIGKLLPTAVVKQVIGYIVDYTISLFNKLMGSNWLINLKK